MTGELKAKFAGEGPGVLKGPPLKRFTVGSALDHQSPGSSSGVMVTSRRDSDRSTVSANG